MTAANILRLFDAQERLGAEFGEGYRIDKTPTLTRMVGPSELYFDNVVLHSCLPESRLVDAISEQQAFYAGLGRGLEWKLYDHDEPPGLEAALRAAGFAPEPGRRTLVVTEIGSAVSTAPDGVEIRRIGPTDIADYVTVEDAAFGQDHSVLGASLAERMRRNPQALSVHVAYAEGRPIATGWSNYFPASSFVSLWGGATVKDWRGRGLYHTLVAARLTEAVTRGRRFAYVTAMDTSRPILERQGFQVITAVRNFHWGGPATSPT